jgi:PAS domain S-box-containing protein
VGERLRVETAWHESEERFQTVIENLTEGVVVADLEGNVIHWNPAALAMHGFTGIEDWERKLPEFAEIFEVSTTDGEVLPLDQWPLARAIRGERLRDFVVRLRRLERDWARVFSYAGNVVREPGGKGLVFLTMFDITERARAEEALRASEYQLRSLVEQAPVAIAMLDRNLVYLAVSRRWVTEHEPGPANLIGMRHYDAQPDIPAEWREIHRRALEGTASRSDGELWVRQDGSKRWMRWAVHPWRDAHGAIGGIMILSENITDRKQAEQIRVDNVRLEAENRRVAEANRLKSEFLANMSHELRTPLNGIIGFSELLVDERPGPLNRKQKEYLGDVLNSANHLLQLINDVLDLAKVEAGKFDFQPQTFPPQRAIEEVCAVVRGLANRKQILLKCQTAPDLASVTIDEHRFKQICYNLLSNAVKFTDAAGAVEISATARDADTFEVRVTDTGIGIREADMERLFREFEQLESGASRRFEGTGLGLALTRKLAELQGGSISARSVYGKGSTFTVILPREAKEIKAEG